MIRKDFWETFGSNNSLKETVAGLYFRWQDEKEYEDINDYLTTIKKTIPEAYAITKRPFGIKVKCDDGCLKIDVIEKGDGLEFRASEINKNRTEKIREMILPEEDYNRVRNKQYDNLDNVKNWDDYYIKLKENLALLEKISLGCKERGWLAGQYFEVPVGDGVVMYQIVTVTSSKAKVVLCEGQISDGYISPEFGRQAVISLDEAKKMVKRTEWARRYSYIISKPKNAMEG